MPRKVINKINRVISSLDSAKQITDGHHTFDELYQHRTILFSIICNMFPDKAFKSKLHDDGTMYDDSFIASIKTEEGDYSYHCKLKYWDYFDIKELSKAVKYDGHKPKDIDRLCSLLTKNNIQQRGL